MKNRELPVFLVLIIALAAAYGGLVYTNFCGIIPLLLICGYVNIVDKRKSLVKTINILLVLFAFFFLIDVGIDFLDRIFNFRGNNYINFLKFIYFFRIVAFLVVTVALIFTLKGEKDEIDSKKKSNDETNSEEIVK